MLCALLLSSAICQAPFYCKVQVHTIRVNVYHALLDPDNWSLHPERHQTLMRLPYKALK